MTMYKARQGPSVNNEVESKELKALLKGVVSWQSSSFCLILPISRL